MGCVWPENAPVERKCLCLIPVILLNASDRKLIKWNLTCVTLVCALSFSEGDHPQETTRPQWETEGGSRGRTISPGWVPARQMPHSGWGETCFSDCQYELVALTREANFPPTARHCCPGRQPGAMCFIYKDTHYLSSSSPLHWVGN